MIPVDVRALEATLVILEILVALMGLMRIPARVQELEGGAVVPGEEEGCAQADEDAEEDHQ